jgi:hypothetical protein
MYREMISMYHAVSFFLKGRDSATADLQQSDCLKVYSFQKLVLVSEGGACPLLLLRLSVALSKFPELWLGTLLASRG